MLFSYQTEGCEYIVKGEQPNEEDTELEVSFVARVNGGRGRLPHAKKVAIASLQTLVSTDVIKTLKE